MPYVLQDRRVGLREPIDEAVAEMKKVCDEDPRQWQSETFKQMVENDLVYIFRLAESSLDFDGGRTIEIDTPIHRVTKVLRARLADGQQIGGDMNFCACRYLVGLTEIHLTPKYEDKIQWIQERIECIKRRFFAEHQKNVAQAKKAIGILQCVSLELYLRYAVDYEAKKLAENGDIMD